jgi:hypothetical protein
LLDLLNTWEKRGQYKLSAAQRLPHIIQGTLWSTAAMLDIINDLRRASLNVNSKLATAIMTAINIIIFRAKDKRLIAMNRNLTNSMSRVTQRRKYEL